MFRVTETDLQGMLKRLNSLSKKRYAINSAYSKKQLVVLVNGTNTINGINDVSCLGTRSEIYYIMQGIIHYLTSENDNFVAKN